MSLQSCGRTAVATGVFEADESSLQALAAMRRERETLLSELSRLQAEEERVIARLDKLEERLAAVETQLSGGKMQKTQRPEKTGAESCAPSAGASGAPAHIHRAHAAEHAAGGMSAAIKRSIGRAVQSFAQEEGRTKSGRGEAHQVNQSAPEVGASENAAKAVATQDGAAAARPHAAGVRRTKTGIGRADQKTADNAKPKGMAAGKGKEKDKEKAASDNPFAGLQAALNAFDQTF